MIRFIVITLALTFVSISCSSKEKKTETAAPTPEASYQPRSLREAFPQNLPKQSANLVTLLKTAGIKSQKSDNTFGYRAYDVSCSSVECSLRASPGGKKLSLKGEKATQLAGIIFDLPVSQGDSGAETPFVECWTDNKDYNNCNVAIQIDYSGP